MNAKKRHSGVRETLSGLLPAFIFVLIAAIVIISTSIVSTNTKEEALRIAHDSIKRAVITCYAQEGAYPPDIEYLEKNYGLRVNDGYIVHYDTFGANIMPEITVLSR